MNKIEELRGQLYLAIDIGDKRKSLVLSRKIDKLILKFMLEKKKDVVTNEKLS